MNSIKVILKSDDTKTINEYNSIINNKKITYKENNCITVLDYSNNLRLSRENDDYYILLEFINNKETKGICKLKKENQILNLDILTDYVIIEDDLIVVKYKILTTGQNVIYRLEIKNDFRKVK